MEEQIRTAFTEMTDKIWGWVKALITNLPNLVVALIVFAITMIAARLLKRLIKKWMSRTRASKSVSALVANFGALVIILGGLYLGLSALDLDTMATGILTTASISGLIVGLALQNAFANTFAGIVLSLIDDIQIGDWIESKEHKGEVQRITLRATTIRGADNNLVFLPNKDVIDNPLKNLSRTSQSRIILDCGVAYASDLIQVREVTKKPSRMNSMSMKNRSISIIPPLMTARSHIPSGTGSMRRLTSRKLLPKAEAFLPLSRPMIRPALRFHSRSVLYTSGSRHR